MQIEPGRAAFVKATLKPRQIIWFGSKEERPYKFAVQRSGVAPLDVEGTYVQRGFLPRWLATFLGVFMALAITFVMLWIAYKPQVRSEAKELQEAGVSTLAPSPSAKPVAPSAPPSASEPAPSAPADNGGGGGEPKPEQTKEKPKSLLPANNVVLKNLSTKLCADIPGEGVGKRDGRVQQFSCDPTAADNQLWNLEVKVKNGGPGGTDLIQIRNVKDKLCMDLPNFGAAPIHTKITEFTCDGTTSDNQLWWLAKQESGGYWIRNAKSDNKCLEVAGNDDVREEVTLMLFNCTVTDDQEWQIIHPDED